MSAIKDWCVVGRKKLTNWQGGWNTLKEVMVWQVEHYNRVMHYDKIYYDFNEDEAHAMCILLNQGECK
jgi:hypothetical protein